MSCCDVEFSADMVVYYCLVGTAAERGGGFSADMVVYYCQVGTAAERGYCWY